MPAVAWMSFFAPLGRCLAVVLIWIAASASAWAASYDILLDTDNDPATGCTVPTAHGNVAGIERVLATQVDVTTTPSTVTGVALRSCIGGTLGAAVPVSNGSWPVGSFIRGFQIRPVAVVETFLPLAQLGPTSPIVRAVVAADTLDGGDVLSSALLPIRAAVAGVPTLSPWVLALLIAGVGLGGGWLVRRHQANLMVLCVCLALGASGMAWAATMLMDGQTSDWAGQQPRATGNSQSVNLVGLYYDQDASNAYFRIDACERTHHVRGALSQIGGAGHPISYVSRSGNWEIKVDHSTVTVTRYTQCQGSTIQSWGHPHENLNGKHIKDWDTDRRTLLLDDGTKVTMHADNPQGVVHKMTIYDGPISIELNNDTNTVVSQSADPVVARQRDEAEADGETGYARYMPNNAPGAIGYFDFRNVYNQTSTGPAPQCLVAPVDASCINVPLGTTGDFYLNPSQVNDLYDDPRLAHT